MDAWRCRVKSVLTIVVGAITLALFAWWLEAGVMAKVAPGPITGSGVSPIPTCQAVFDPATSRPCSRRDSGGAAGTGDNCYADSADACVSQNQQAVSAAIHAQMSAANPVTEVCARDPAGAARVTPPCPGYDPSLRRPTAVRPRRPS